MTDIPATITVGPHTYKVLTGDHVNKILDAEGCEGQVRTHTLKMRVRVDRPHTQIADTIVHEILHAAWAQTGLRASKNIDSYEEVVIESLAPLLLGALRSNPDLVAYLTGEA